MKTTRLLAAALASVAFPSAAFALTDVQFHPSTVAMNTQGSRMVVSASAVTGSVTLATNDYLEVKLDYYVGYITSGGAVFVNSLGGATPADFTVFADGVSQTTRLTYTGAGTTLANGEAVGYTVVFDSQAVPGIGRSVMTGTGGFTALTAPSRPIAVVDFPAGPAGPQGAAGLQGPQGPAGADGADGKKGAAGGCSVAAGAAEPFGFATLLATLALAGAIRAASRRTRST